ncbi:hypothetical protein [Rhodoblastus sp.]|uniref:hypothetical protein n=1 Tax=Rhodoblastus sp. TaxID=1962975 RepID=UPI003F99FB4D
MTARRADFAVLAGVALALALAGPSAARAGEGEPANDYPTDARADYVFACMAANGQTREVLGKCSCSLDALASILPFDKYVAAETVLSMRQGAGRTANTFSNTPRFDDMVADLRRAQAEAEIRCF